MRPDGSGLRRLTDEPSDNRFLRPGPPGTSLVAFTSDRGGIRGLYLMEPDGSEVRVLYDGPGDDQFPSWSPDGERLLFGPADDLGSPRRGSTSKTSPLRARIVSVPRAISRRRTRRR